MEGSKPPKRSAKKSAEETPRILRLEFPFPPVKCTPGMPFLFKKYALFFGGKGAGVVVVLPPQFIKMAPFKKAKIPKQPGEFGWFTRLSYQKLYTVHTQKTGFC